MKRTMLLLMVLLAFAHAALAEDFSAYAVKTNGFAVFAPNPISENGDMIDRGDFTFDGEALYLNMLGYGFIGRLLPQEDGSLLEENSELEYVWVAESDVPEAVLTAPLE